MYKDGGYLMIDTHAHYDDEAFDEDREMLLSSLPEQGIVRVVNMGASMEGARASLSLSHRFAHVYAGIGIHPDHVGDLNEDSLTQLRQMACDERCVVIGEIGLDYHWDIEPREVQQAGFIQQMHLATALGLPINVHSRDAAQDTFDLIRREHGGTTGGVIHCYSGSLEMAREYVKMGYVLGIGGVITFKNAKTLVKVVEDIPIEYLVTETDCPYMAPTPYRGKRNSSLYIPLVIKRIAEIKGMAQDEAAEQLYQNALRVYRWPEGIGQG